MIPLKEQAFFIYKDTLIYTDKSTKYAAIDPDGQIVTSDTAMEATGIWTSDGDLNRLFFVEFDEELLGEGRWRFTHERVYPIDTLEAIVFVQSKQTNKPNE